MSDKEIIEQLMGKPVAGRRVSAYDWLGLEPFEDDPQKIIEAADRVMRKLQQAVSPYNDLPEGRTKQTARRLLNETIRRKRILLNPVAKADYDQRLRFFLGYANELGQIIKEPPVIPSLAIVTGNTKAPGFNLIKAAPAVQNAARRMRQLRRRREERIKLLFVITGGITGLILGYCLLVILRNN